MPGFFYAPDFGRAVCRQAGALDSKSSSGNRVLACLTVGRFDFHLEYEYITKEWQ
jgi:hypothetical protein